MRSDHLPPIVDSRAALELLDADSTSERGARVGRQPRYQRMVGFTVASLALLLLSYLLVSAWDTPAWDAAESATAAEISDMACQDALVRRARSQELIWQTGSDAARTLNAQATADLNVAQRDITRDCYYLRQDTKAAP